MNSKIQAMGETLRHLIEDRGIIARCELLQRVYQTVRNSSLTKAEREELMRMVGKRPAPGIFANILSGEPIFFNFPLLDSFTVMDGRIFHFIHTAKYDRSDFRKAYDRFRLNHDELMSLVVLNLSDLLVEFMMDAGYRLAQRQLPEDGPAALRFSSLLGEEVICLVYPRIGHVNMKEIDSSSGQVVVLVPHEESLDPFVRFFKEKGVQAEEAGLQFWVANMEEGSIDPFIGYTRDPEVYKRFKNPRLSSMVRSMWERSQ
jgi:hypothetical protein